MAYQRFPDDQTLRLQTGAGEDDIIYLPSGLDRVDCERQEEEEGGSQVLQNKSRMASNKPADGGNLLTFIQIHT